MLGPWAQEVWGSIGLELRVEGLGFGILGSRGGRIMALGRRVRGSTSEVWGYRALFREFWIWCQVKPHSWSKLVEVLQVLRVRGLRNSWQMLRPRIRIWLRAALYRTLPQAYIT